MQAIKLNVRGMKCEGCAGTVREALQDVEGVLGAEVSLEDGAARLQVEERVAPGDLVAAVEETGYGASVI